jgi:hypothetical protein
MLQFPYLDQSGTFLGQAELSGDWPTSRAPRDETLRRATLDFAPKGFPMSLQGQDGNSCCRIALVKRPDFGYGRIGLSGMLTFVEPEYPRVTDV